MTRGGDRGVNIAVCTASRRAGGTESALRRTVCGARRGERSA